MTIVVTIISFHRPPLTGGHGRADFAQPMHRQLQDGIKALLDDPPEFVAVGARRTKALRRTPEGLGLFTPHGLIPAEASPLPVTRYNHHPFRRGPTGRRAMPKRQYAARVPYRVGPVCAHTTPMARTICEARPYCGRHRCIRRRRNIADRNDRNIGMRHASRFGLVRDGCRRAISRYPASNDTRRRLRGRS